MTPAPPWSPAETIDDVVEQLSEIIDQSRAAGSRLAYFPALYRKVTIEVGRRIDAGYFDDGPRMERLDVVFANRYLEAFHAYRRGDPTSRSWRFAFRVAEHRTPIVLQHLLLGMQAHISLDLGVSAAAVSPGSELVTLKPDFLRINDVLADLVDDVRDELAQIWTSLRVLNRTLGPSGNMVANFNMRRARDWAWKVATQLAPLDPDARHRQIAVIDAQVAALARLIRYPGVTLNAATKLIRLGERGSTRRKADYLCSWRWPPEERPDQRPAR